MSETCPNCGTPVRTNYRFCADCGALLPTASSVQTPASTSTPTDNDAPADEVGMPKALPSQNPPAYVVRQSDTLSNEAPVPNIPEDNTENSPSSHVPPLPAILDQRRVGERTPPSLGRRADATYTPYVPEAVKHLQDPRSDRSWLMPIIIACLVALLGLLGAGIYLNSFANPNAAGGFQNPSVRPASLAEENAIKAVIRRSNEDEIISYRNLDATLLKATRTGKVLDEANTRVQSLRSKNIYAVAVNNNLEIDNVRTNGNTATAHTIEAWTVTYYNKSDNKVVDTPDSGTTTLDETYHLVKKGDNWLIDDLQITRIR